MILLHLLLLQLFEHLFLEAVPEPKLLLLGVEDHLGVHAGAEAEVVPALLALPPRLGRDLARAVVLAGEVWGLGRLVCAAEKGAATEIVRWLYSRLLSGKMFFAKEMGLWSGEYWDQS